LGDPTELSTIRLTNLHHGSETIPIRDQQNQEKDILRNRDKPRPWPWPTGRQSTTEEHQQAKKHQAQIQPGQTKRVFLKLSWAVAF